MSTQEFDIETQDAEAPDRGLICRTFAAHLSPGDGRTIDVRIVPYGEKITHNDGLGGVPRGVEYQEEWLPGVFSHQLKAAHRVVANFEHQPGIAGIVGKGIALREASDGFHGSFRILNTAAGDTMLELLRDDDGERTVDGVSLEAIPVKNIRAGGVIQRAKANLRGIAFTRFGAYSGARVLAVREEAAITIDEALLPVDMDPDLVERCRQAGMKLPQRYEAHPDDNGHPGETGTPGDGTRQPIGTPSSEE